MTGHDRKYPETAGKDRKCSVSIYTNHHSSDTKFLSTFIATYQSFTTPGRLLEKLLQRYDAKGRIEDKRVTPIQLRVCVVLKYWIANQCADFDASLIQDLQTFLITQLPRDQHNELSKQLTNLLSTNLEELSVKKKAHTVNPFSSLQVQVRFECFAPPKCALRAPPVKPSKIGFGDFPEAIKPGNNPPPNCTKSCLHNTYDDHVKARSLKNRPKTEEWFRPKRGTQPPLTNPGFL